MTHTYIYCSIKTSKMHKISKRYQRYEAKTREHSKHMSDLVKMGYLSSDRYAHPTKNPTYVSHESEREITWDNIRNDYIMKTCPKNDSPLQHTCQKQSIFCKIYKYIHTCTCKSSKIITSWTYIETSIFSKISLYIHNMEIRREGYVKIPCHQLPIDWLHEFNCIIFWALSFNSSSNHRTFLLFLVYTRTFL